MSIDDKIKERNKLMQQVAQRKAWVDKKAAALSRREQGMGSMGDNATAQEFSANLQSVLPADLVPGNVGDLNKVIWPFFFRTNLQTFIVPGQTTSTTFSVTQEASFIWMSFTKCVFEVTDAGLATETWEYIDDSDPANAGVLQGLTFTISDALSTRDFMNTPVDMSQVGLPRFPFKFPRPVMFLPNANIQINFTNATALNLVPFVMAFGYRLRLENAQDILSLVYSR